MNTRNPYLHACHNTALELDPALGGRVQVEFELDANGVVVSAHTRGNELTEEIGECILAEVRTWRTGAVEGGCLTVRRTYLFEPWEGWEGSAQ